ncbi:epoxide hydrolase [Microbacterium gorillae]|uniref:epoxide hydrolase n=1 Tax=Microbacterium gorillae TaxID=1231063 RepID=UPI000694AD64|nr:epoxide hydrolase [Microbacterium gorillae]
MTACYQSLSGVLPDLDWAAGELRTRLRASRLPATASLVDGDYGPSHLVVAEAVTRWIDWLEPTERAAGVESHAMVQVDGIDLHVLRISGEGVLPLLLVHGWPTSFLMFHRVIGGLRAVCSELVLVSMPGFGTSPLPRASWSALDSSKLLLKMMEALEFDLFAVHGEDWGSVVARAMGTLAPDRVAGVHVSAGLHGFLADGTDEDQAWRDLQRYAMNGSAYLRLQAERPDSLAFALADSPVGILAWQLDKYSLWQAALGTDFGIEDDFIFANATLYWLTNSAATSMRLFATSRPDATPVFSPVPTAVSRFGVTDFASHAVSERYNNLVGWYEHGTGGHMAALDSPTELVNDLSVFMQRITQLGAHS